MSFYVPSWASNGPCRGCPDRCPEPNCHLTCEKFIEWQKKIEEKKSVIVKKRKEQKVYNGYIRENTTRWIKSPQKGTLQQKRASKKHRSVYFLDGGGEDGEK